MSNDTEMSVADYLLSLGSFLGAGVIIARLISPIVQSVVSAMIGVAVLLMLIRGLRRPGMPTVGNFWLDLFRGSLYLLFPLSLLITLLLNAQRHLNPLIHWLIL